MKKKLQIVNCYICLKQIEKNVQIFENSNADADFFDTKNNLKETLRLCELMLFKFNLINLSLAISKKELNSCKVSSNDKENLNAIITKQKDILINIANRSKLNDFEKFYLIHNLPL